MPFQVDVNVSSAGANAVIAPVSGKQIVVLNYVLVTANAVAATWQSSGGTVLAGPMSFAANGGAAAPYNPVGHFRTAVGEGLDLFLGGGVAVGGHVSYALV